MTVIDGRKRGQRKAGAGARKYRDAQAKSPGAFGYNRVIIAYERLRAALDDLDAKLHPGTEQRRRSRQLDACEQIASTAAHHLLARADQMDAMLGPGRLQDSAGKRKRANQAAMRGAQTERERFRHAMNRWRSSHALLARRSRTTAAEYEQRLEQRRAYEDDASGKLAELADLAERARF